MPHDPVWILDIHRKKRITVLPPRFKIVKSSHEPLRYDPDNELVPHLISQTDQLADRVRSLESFVRDSGSTSLEHRVKRLEVEKKGDFKAIKTLYHRVVANCTKENAMGAHYRA